MQDYSIEQMVANGITLLDSKNPGWLSKIDLETLDMGRYEHCVLGQLYGNYVTGLDALDILEDYEDRFDYGFSLSPDTYHTWSELTDIWKSEINMRRELRNK